MALRGTKVIDLTRILAGPFCTQLLADMGADVIKVESGAGDPVRSQGTVREGLSWYFAQFNRNKRSITLNLRTEAGKEALARLLEGADVLVENFRPGVLAKMGFDEARLRAINPQLVVASVNGYGSTGPYVDRPSFDFIAQAMSGFMSVNGAPDDPPMRAGPPISDLIAGLYAAFGVVCALMARGRCVGPGSAGGQHVESSLTGGLISMLAFLSAEYFARGEVPARTGNDHSIVAPYGLFAAADGVIAVAPSNDLFVVRFLEAIGLVHILEQPQFATNPVRMQNREALRAIIEQRTRTNTVDYWIETINAGGCPCGRVMNLPEVFSDAQVQAQDMVLEVNHPGHGLVRMTGFPVKLSETPCQIRLPAPGLGEHNDEVLSALGYDAAAIAKLSQV
ncbi:MAG: CoA:oxalate CoA-transferase [Gammaproteobacteria bacterium]|jgi:CoA:oxalate CoA-transferase